MPASTALEEAQEEPLPGEEEAVLEAHDASAPVFEEMDGGLPFSHRRRIHNGF